MGKYFSGRRDAAGSKGGRGCGGLPGGYINDVIGKGCWAVVGQTIIIGGSTMSIQAGFECCNFNFRTDTTSSPVPIRASLPGPVGTGIA